MHLSLLLLLAACGDDVPDYDGVPTEGETGRLIGFTNEHNIHRTAVGAPDLVYDNGELQTAAEEWLVHLIAEQNCDMVHNLDSPLGENLAWNRGFESNPGLVMEGWMLEEANYDYDSNTCAGRCGHYLQVIWSETTSVGCAVDICEDGADIWMCTYDPAGNIPDELPY